MYVKVTRGEGHGDVLHHVGDYVHTDQAVASIQDLENDSIDYTELMGAQCDQLHICEVDPQQTAYEKNHDIFVLRYAWWYDQHGTRIGLVTTRNIFILGDNGKTVDRVR